MLKLQENLVNSYVAFIDVMGFSNLVNNNRTTELESYFEKVIEVLKKIRGRKRSIKSFLISDAIILIAPDGTNGLIDLINATRSIQSSLLWRKIILRGAISYGPVYYNAQENIIVGKGFIKAYKLEQQAIYPRVIIDPLVISHNAADRTEFFELINEAGAENFDNRLLYNRSGYSTIPDDGIFIDYANKTILQESINGNLKKVYEIIKDNLYSEQALYNKYIWLRNYYLERLTINHAEIEHIRLTGGQLSIIQKNQVKKLQAWIIAFDRL